MGCTTSSPLVATGSGMLKAASHVAADATKSAEDAIEDVTETLGKTIDVAKENVGTAVTGIANELSNTIKEKTDETKTTIMEKLHLNNGHEKESTEGNVMANKQSATGSNNEKNNSNGINANADNNVDDDDGVDIEDEENDIIQRLSRAPMPTPTAPHRHMDSDSLKTTASEPEIEQALANRNENSPPTPQPSYSELVRLSAELHDFTKAADMISDSQHDAMSMLASNTTTSMQQQAEAEGARNSTFQYRPHTTEWEKYADLLAKSQRFHPNEVLLRRRFVRPHGIDPVAAGATITSALIDGAKQGTENDLGAMGFLGKPLSRNQSKTNILIAPESQYFNDLTNFPAGHAMNRIRVHDGDGDEDESANNESNSSPVPGESRYSAKTPRKRVIRNFPTHSAKKIHRQLVSLMGLDSNSAREKSGTHGHTGNRSSNSAVGRYFDFNPNRMRVGSPNLIRRRNGQTFFPIRLSDTPSRWGANRIGTQPIKVPPIKQRSRRSSITVSSIPKPILSSSSSPSRIGLHSIGIMNSANSSHPRSRSSLSSVHNTTTPLSRSPSKSSLSNIALGVIPDSQHLHYPPIQSITRPTTPVLTTGVIGGPAVIGIVKEPIRNVGSGKPRTLGNKNTSSFLSSPRTSPFPTPRKSFIHADDKENKASFVAELSSVTDNRNSLIPSPYKVRERCAVCFNKYTVK